MDPDYSSDWWADFDEDAGFGSIDSDYWRKQVPQGFIYSCCKRAGDQPGCVIGRHSKRKIVPKKPDPMLLQVYSQERKRLLAEHRREMENRRA